MQLDAVESGLDRTLGSGRVFSDGLCDVGFVHRGGDREWLLTIAVRPHLTRRCDS